MKRILVFTKITFQFTFYWGFAILLIFGLIQSLNQPYDPNHPQPVFGQILGMIGCVALIIKPFEYLDNRQDNQSKRT
jgi:hypothetical protein